MTTHKLIQTLLDLFIQKAILLTVVKFHYYSRFYEIKTTDRVHLYEILFAAGFLQQKSLSYV